MKDLLQFLVVIDLMAAGICLGLGFTALGTRRVVGRSPFLVAVGACGAGLLVTTAFTACRTAVAYADERTKWEPTRAWAAARPLAAGTTVEATAMVEVKIPHQFDTGSFGDPAHGIGRKVLVAVPKGAVITDSLLAERASDFCAWMLAPRSRPPGEYPDGGSE